MDGMSLTTKNPTLGGQPRSGDALDTAVGSFNNSHNNFPTATKGGVTVEVHPTKVTSLHQAYGL